MGPRKKPKPRYRIGVDRLVCKPGWPGEIIKPGKNPGSI